MKIYVFKAWEKIGFKILSVLKFPMRQYYHAFIRDEETERVSNSKPHCFKCPRQESKPGLSPKLTIACKPGIPNT